jgi:hypothetical protein
MAYVIFEVKKEQIAKINDLARDDLVSRQSILTRDATALGIDKDVSYTKIEGSEEGLKRAEELAKELELVKLDENQAVEVDKKIKEEEESAADGMGMIFG